MFSTTFGPELVLLPKSETDDNQARPSREFKRTQKVIRTFSQSNLNVDPNAKVTASLKEKPKKIAFRPLSDYDYYDDGDGIVGRSTSKVGGCVCCAQHVCNLDKRKLKAIQFQIYSCNDRSK